MESVNKEHSKYTNELNSYKHYLIMRLGMVCMGQVDREELIKEYKEAICLQKVKLQ